MEGHNPGKPKWRGIFRASYAPYLGEIPSTFLDISTVQGATSSIIGTYVLTYKEDSFDRFWHPTWTEDCVKYHVVTSNLPALWVPGVCRYGYLGTCTYVVAT